MLRQRGLQLAHVEQPVDTAKKVVARQHAIYGSGARPGPSILASRAHHGAAPSFSDAKHREEINVSGVLQQPRTVLTPISHPSFSKGLQVSQTRARMKP
ncbi:hypothetical protein [Sphingomonas sp. LH128]|uniref:hypothetical protein n=1 Tax=Sphingomonas sp. LH128 TaxID=473781 RepID=UPI00155E06E0|nr:hypothetical protein [Sphingomonas sp. LH128]